MKKTQTIYRTKVAAWLVAVIIGAIVIPIIPIMIYDFSWVVLAIITLLLLFSLYLLFSISYTINGNTLIVKCGIFSTAKYNIDDIYKIIDTNTTLASLASSLERIAIYFKGQKHPLIISPKNKQIFINNLQKINDKITWLQ